MVWRPFSFFLNSVLWWPDGKCAALLILKYGEMWIIGCGHVLCMPWPCHLPSYVIFKCWLLQCINKNSLSFGFHYLLGSSIHNTPHTTQPRLLVVKQPFLGAKCWLKAGKWCHHCCLWAFGGLGLKPSL